MRPSKFTRPPGHSSPSIHPPTSLYSSVYQYIYPAVCFLTYSPTGHTDHLPAHPSIPPHTDLSTHLFNHCPYSCLPTHLPTGHSSFSPLFTRHACPGPWPFLCHPPLHSTALYSVHSILRSQGCLLLGVSRSFHLSKESVHLLSLLPASLHPFFMCNKQDHVCHMPLCTGRTCEFPALELPMGSEVETRVLRQCRGPPFAQGRGAGLQTPWEGWKVLTAGKPGQENFWSRHSSRI